MNKFDNAMAIIAVDDLMDICGGHSGNGFVTFIFAAGLIGAGIGIRSLMKKVDRLEERCRELESSMFSNDSKDIDNLSDFDLDD